MHDLELGQESYDILKMLQLQNWRFRFGFHGSDLNLSRDFHRI
jgi:hypothetical protein